MIGDTRAQPASDGRTYAVVDLFCGAGGLAYGLKSAGLDVKVGVDLDPSCRYPLEENTGAKFVQRNVTEVEAEDLVDWFGDADVRVLAGCAPCQPFSTYSRSRKSKDDRWELLKEFERLAIATRPDVVTMENVVGLVVQDVWKEFVAALNAAGYRVWYSRVACDEFGVPQSRRRLVLLASLHGPIELRRSDEDVTVALREAIGDLPPLAAGEASAEDPLHVCASLSPMNLERMRASRPGGTWRDWPEDMRASCHRRATGKTYPGVYGRMEWGRPAPTMTTQCYGFGNGRFGHPEQDRAISLREAAIIQSFPRDYRFLRQGERVSFERLGTLIGNAVPPKLGERIGATILAHFAAAGSSRPGLDGQLDLR